MRYFGLRRWTVSSEVLKVFEMSEAQEQYVQTALTGHYVSSPNVGVHIEKMDRDRCMVWGHSTSIMESGPPVVVLLSEDSTPQKAKVHPDAGSKFEAAARRLIRDGVEFYTVLRPGWALPALRWTLEYR